MSQILRRFNLLAIIKPVHQLINLLELIVRMTTTSQRVMILMDDRPRYTNFLKEALKLKSELYL